MKRRDLNFLDCPRYFIQIFGLNFYKNNMNIIEMRKMFGIIGVTL